MDALASWVSAAMQGQHNAWVSHKSAPASRVGHMDRLHVPESVAHGIVHHGFRLCQQRAGSLRAAM